MKQRKRLKHTEHAKVMDYMKTNEATLEPLSAKRIAAAIFKDLAIAVATGSMGTYREEAGYPPKRKRKVKPAVEAIAPVSVAESDDPIGALRIEVAELKNDFGVKLERLTVALEAANILTLK